MGRPVKNRCVHCKYRQASQQDARGLCWTCRQDPEIRKLHPSTSKFAAKSEPTEEEFEAIIAEQRKCLPPWFFKQKKMRKNKLDS